MFIIFSIVIGSISVFAMDTNSNNTDEQVVRVSLISDANITNNHTLAQSTINYINNMSVDELNNFINNIAEKYLLMEAKINNNTINLKTTTPTSVDSIYYDPIVEIKAAWLAAAQIAKLKGYTCSATLVEHSVLGKNYYEQSSIFSQK
ncbi:hypothetical protein PL321_11770 [Caloramator sp. mosi_1]|uniref:hypothetical protein n=1 Tax=Caloramator sp. mosi_1 TaxID=3023090 RepID=UPI00235E2326|nr:hypothetical protein [Caloramator sp. mosi_1]WDC83416.1 hypothetical protein PL321_11770 [Caloramator sp. mosi_1]